MVIHKNKKQYRYLHIGVSLDKRLVKRARQEFKIPTLKVGTYNYRTMDNNR